MMDYLLENAGLKNIISGWRIKEMEKRMIQGKCIRLQTKCKPALALLFMLLSIFIAGQFLIGMPAEAEEGSEKISFRFVENDEVRYFETDYGFSEDRAWVRGLDQETYLINPAGEIIYTVPKHVVINGTAEEIIFERFYPVENGITWFTGRTHQSARYEVDISFIIDKDGNEITHFMTTEDVICYIAGRTNDRFLLIWNDISGRIGKLYFIPIGLDGQAADVPRLMTSENTFYYSTEVYNLGEGIFLWNGIPDENSRAYYNLNNNTVQKSYESFLCDTNSRFFHGSTLSNGYLLTVDQLQEDRTNFIISDKERYTEKTLVFNPLSQYGNIWMDGTLYGKDEMSASIYDRTGAKLEVPEEIGFYNFVEVSASDDGYVLFQESSPTGKTLLSMMDPDYNFLYIQKAFPAEITPVIGRGGYVTAIWKNQSNYMVYGIIDRAGERHTFEDDLSVFPDLAELYFKGFGSGWLLETTAHLGDEKWSKATAVIRSLDGKTEISSLHPTSETRTMNESLTVINIPDLSQAKPIGLFTAENAAAEMTSEDEVRAMEEDGIIYLKKQLNQEQNVLLFEKEGIRLTCRIIPNDGWIFRLENNNPENKNAFAILKSEAEYNGMTITGSGGQTNSVSAGKSAWFSTFFLTEGEFMIAMGQFGQRLGELPLTEITIHFTVGIGQDPSVEYARTLRSASWSDDGLDVLYEEFVGDYKYNGNLIYSVYRVPDEHNVAFVIKNQTDTELVTGPSILYLLTTRFVNGSKIGNSLQVEVQPGKIAIVPFGNIDRLYTQLQITDGIPLNLEMSIPLPGDEAHTVFNLDLGQISNTPERKDKIIYIQPKPGSKQDEKGNRIEVSFPDKNEADEPANYLEKEFELIGDQLFRNGDLFCDYSAFGGVQQIWQIGDQFWIITRNGYFYVMNYDLQTMSDSMIPLNPEAEYVLNEYGLFETIYENFRPVVTRRITSDGSVLGEYENMDVEDILAPYQK